MSSGQSITSSTSRAVPGMRCRWGCAVCPCEKLFESFVAARGLVRLPMTRFSRILPAALMTVCLAAVLAQGLAYAAADLILYNGNIITMDSLTPSAQTIAIQGKWITAVGPDAQ